MKSHVIYAAALAVGTFLGGATAVVAQDEEGKQDLPQDQTRPDEKPADQGGFDDQNLPGEQPKGVEQRAQIGMPAPDFTLQALDGTSHSLSQYRGKILVLEWFDPSSLYVMKHHKDNKTMKDLAEEYRDDGVAWLAIVSGKLTDQSGQSGFPGATDPSGQGGMGGDQGGMGGDQGGMGGDQDLGNQGGFGGQGDQGLQGQQGGIDEAKLRQVVQEWEVKYPVLLDRDGKVAKQFGVQTSSQVFVIDKQGTLVYMGAIDDDPSTDEVGGTNYIEEALEALIDGDPIETPVTTPYGDRLNQGGQELEKPGTTPETPREGTTPPAPEGTVPPVPPTPPSK